MCVFFLRSSSSAKQCPRIWVSIGNSTWPVIQVVKGSSHLYITQTVKLWLYGFIRRKNISDVLCQTNRRLMTRHIYALVILFNIKQHVFLFRLPLPLKVWTPIPVLCARCIVIQVQESKVSLLVFYSLVGGRGKWNVQCNVLRLDSGSTLLATYHPLIVRCFGKHFIHNFIWRWALSLRIFICWLYSDQIQPLYSTLRVHYNSGLIYLLCWRNIDVDMLPIRKPQNRSMQEKIA